MGGSGGPDLIGSPTEEELAIWYANKLLDEPSCDPDDDIRRLARQFLRSVEALDEMKKRSAVETDEAR